MKVLLDESVTRHLKQEFIGHEVFTIDEAGFKGLKNGELLRAATGLYDVLVTVDQNLPYQQNLKSFDLAVLVLIAKRNTYATLKSLMPKALSELTRIQAGQFVEITMA